MSSVQVFELCKVCKRPSKMRIDFLGKIEIVDVICDCVKKERAENEHTREKTKNTKILKPTVGQT